MTETNVEELQQSEAAPVEKPLSTADLVHRADATATQREAAAAPATPERTPLFPDAELGGLRQQWLDAQTQFVDDPRNAVRHADELVASLMKRLAEVFASEREKLEHGWDKGDDVSTEDLRQALRRYRSFFDRLLSV